MKLSEWVAAKAKKTKKTKTAILKELATVSGVSLLTLQIAERGAPLSRYPKAKSISEATKGAVTIEDLCEQ